MHERERELEVIEDREPDDEEYEEPEEEEEYEEPEEEYEEVDRLDGTGSGEYASEDVWAEDEENWG